MTSAVFTPPPRPPHDPFHVLLDGRAGWRSDAHPALTQAVGPSPGSGGLALMRLPGSGFPLTDPFGSFGGLTWPSHVALLPGDALVLLDRGRGQLRRFDPCSCRFQDWPCLGGAHADPRRLLQPGGMASGCGRLYVCDTGHHRLLVIEPASGTLQAVWQSPRLPGLAPWQPVAVAVDGQGAVLVSDPANGGIHVFSPRGAHRRFFGGLGAVSTLTLHSRGWILLRLEGEDAIAVINPGSGAIERRAMWPEEVAAGFPPLPLKVLPGGVLDASGYGLCPDAPPALFDQTGEPTQAAEAPLRYPRRGTWISQPLDSGISRCIWHRLVIRGELPQSTGVLVSALTSESEDSPETLALRPAGDWGPVATWSRPAQAPEFEAEWDLLFRCQPGRYLRLKLEVAGDGATTPRIDALELEFPRISLRRYLPACFGAEPVAADFTDRWLALFDQGFRQIESQIDQQAQLFDPLACPAGPSAQNDFLTWLSGWVGVSLERSWPEARRRAYLKAAPRLFRWRGTPSGLRESLYLFLGLDRYVATPPQLSSCEPCALQPRPLSWRPPQLLLEHFRLRRWLLLGQGRLSDNARLWGDSIANRSRLGGSGDEAGAGGSGGARLGVNQLRADQDPCLDPFNVYAHRLSVFVPASCLRKPSTGRALRQLVALEKPAHVDVQLIPVEPRFQVGVQAMLGLDAVVGWSAAAQRLDESALGRGTVLAGAVDAQPRFRVGAARLGEQTTLP